MSAPTSLRASLRRALLFSASFAIVAFGGVAVVSTLDLEPASVEGTAGTTHADPATPSPVADLLDKHDCWTGPAPAEMQGDVPGHVVVTQDGRLRYGGPRLVDVALGHVFEKPVDGLVVHGFCKGGAR